MIIIITCAGRPILSDTLVLPLESGGHVIVRGRRGSARSKDVLAILRISIIKTVKEIGCIIA